MSALPVALPCPHCGETPKAWAREYVGGFAVLCNTPGCQSRRHRETEAGAIEAWNAELLAFVRAETEEAARALFDMVLICLQADMREDAPEFVNGEHVRGMFALRKCEDCNGTGSADGKLHEDAVVDACAKCGGWGFFPSVAMAEREPCACGDHMLRPGRCWAAKGELHKRARCHMADGGTHYRRGFP